MKLGDFVKVEYTGKLEDGTVFDSTDPTQMENATGPIIVVLGAGHLIPGLDKELLNMKLKQEKEVLIEPKDGFGNRDSKKIKIYKASAFKKDDMRPMPGARVLIDNKLATILSVSAGRVVVDFNHPLSSRKLVYKLKLIEQVKDLEKQVAGLLKFHLGGSPKFKLDTELNQLSIEDVSEPIQQGLEQEVKRYTSFKKVLFISNKG
ncbi:MAG: peptidylprolyl isomerase [Candidatus Altiarchaeota archaeon]|nr:peptidylprolyl isomerase [Candidatus Altiarchaeota archaeon]